MWIMLMLTIIYMSCLTKRWLQCVSVTSICMGGARLFEGWCFCQSVMLAISIGLRSVGIHWRGGRCVAKYTACSPVPLEIYGTVPCGGITCKITSRITSRFRWVAGAYWRLSFIFSTNGSAKIVALMRLASSTQLIRSLLWYIYCLPPQKGLTHTSISL